MTSMEREALDAIAKNDGRLHYYLIAADLKISSHYAYVICKGLERSGYVNFNVLKGICTFMEKGKETVVNNWFFKLKKQRERVQERIRKNREKILSNTEIINY